MHTTTRGNMPGVATPTIEKAPGACNTEGLTTNTTNDLNFAMGERGTP